MVFKDKVAICLLCLQNIHLQEGLQKYFQKEKEPEFLVQFCISKLLEPSKQSKIVSSYMHYKKPHECN